MAGRRDRLPAMPRQACRNRGNAAPAAGATGGGSVRTLLLSTCLAASLATAAPEASAPLAAAERKAAVDAIATGVSKRFQRQDGQVTGFEMFGEQGDPVTVKRTG